MKKCILLGKITQNTFRDALYKCQYNDFDFHIEETEIGQLQIDLDNYDNVSLCTKEIIGKIIFPSETLTYYYNERQGNFTILMADENVISDKISKIKKIINKHKDLYNYVTPVISK